MKARKGLRPSASKCLLCSTFEGLPAPDRGGVGWLTFLAPPLAARAYPYAVTIALFGTAAQIVWLLVYRVNERRWKTQAGRAAQSIWA